MTSHTRLENGVNAYFVELCSGKWQDIMWNHRLRILVPTDQSTGAILFVTGSGSGTDEIVWLSEVALVTGQIVAILHDVPNQPLFDGLREDVLIHGLSSWKQRMLPGYVSCQ
jgi:PhoPQ-activated pathogenicity-related protein